MKKALKSGELVKKKFKDSVGKEHVLYERFQVAGKLQNSTKKKNYKLEALIYENYKLDCLIYKIYKLDTLIYIINTLDCLMYEIL